MNSLLKAIAVATAIGSAQARARSSRRHVDPDFVISIYKDRAAAKRIRKANRGPGFSSGGNRHV